MSKKSNESTTKKTAKKKVEKSTKEATDNSKEIKKVVKDEKVATKEINKKEKKLIVKDNTKEELKTAKVSKNDIRDKKIKKKQNKCFAKSLIISLIVLMICSVLLYPVMKNTKFGLDLKGGFEILYEVKDVNGKKVSKDAVTNTYKTILKRIDILGVSEPEIAIEGNNIRIQLAGVKDKKQAKETLSSMANLTFRNSKDELVMTSDVLKPNGVKVKADENNIGYYYLTLDIKDVDTFHKKTEEIRKSDSNVMVIWLDYDEERDSFKKEQKDCGSLGNSRCISYASINGELTTNTVTLTGNFEKEEAEALANLINSGSLPTKLVELSSKTVDASFGENALKNTFLAGCIAIGIIVLFMISLYRFSGFIASISIIAYTLLTFVIFNYVGGRLTLPSIAAVVIGIGMAVDSVVLSFERIKDSLRNKNNLEKAFKEGNKESLVSIIDSNITTLIAAIILFIFGESSVKGFATMLIVSIFATLSIMVYLNRLLLRGFVKSGKFENHYKAFVGLKDINKKSFLSRFNYIKHGLKFGIMTIVIFIVGTACLYFNGLNLSIEFKGGSTVSISSSEKLNTDKIELDFVELGYEIDSIDKLDNGMVYVIIGDTLDAKDTDKIDTYFNKEYKDVTTSIGSVSNSVKKELVKNAVKSLILAAIGMIIYTTLRFTFRYGVAAILTLLHDVLFVLFVFSLLRFEVSTMFIAAILSIIGYSINDTIVTFDRIRETKRKKYNDKLKSYDELKNLVNTSIKDTITRNIVTAITTFIPIICLMILGSHEVSAFNIAMLIGLIAGTYSSIYLATYIWMLLEKKHIGKEEKKKWYEVDDKDELEELKVKGINC